MVKRSHRQRETLSDLTNGVEIVVIAHVNHCEVSRRVMLKSNVREIVKLPLYEAAAHLRGRGRRQGLAGLRADAPSESSRRGR